VLTQRPVGASAGFAIGASALVAVGLLAWGHRVSGGAVLSSQPVTVVVFLLAFFGTLVAGGKHWPLRDVSQGWAWCGVAVASAFLVWATWWGDPGGLPGDYTQHRMYTYQLLNGFPAPHVPYAGLPGHYTPLQSAAIALWMQCTGLSFHYAALSFSLLVASGVSWLAHGVALRAGLGSGGALFFAGLVATYGGAWFVGLYEFFLYLPGVQLAMPFLARNLGLLIVLLGVWLAQAAGRGEVSRAAAELGVGVLVGLLGLTRPWEFGIGVVGLLGWAVHARSRAAWVGLGLAWLLSSAYFGPLLVAWWELGVFASREVARSDIWPTSPFLYLPLLPLVGVSAFHWRRAPSFVRACAFGLAGVVFLSVGAGAMVEVESLLGMEGGLFKVDRIGQWIALLWFGLAAYGLEQLRQPVKGAVCVLLLALGFVSTLRVTSTWLDGEPTVFPERWFRPPTWVFGLGGSRLYVRDLLDDPREVVMAPASLGEFIARVNGVDVVYSRSAVPIWREGPFGRSSQAERREAVDSFYDSLRSGTVDNGLLSAWGARWFLAPVSVQANFVTEVGEVRFGGAPWFLHRVGRAREGS